MAATPWLDDLFTSFPDVRYGSTLKTIHMVSLDTKESQCSMFIDWSMRSYNWSI